MGIFDKVRDMFGDRAVAADGQVVAEVLALLQIRHPNPEQSIRMNVLARTIAGSTGRCASQANQLLSALLPGLDAPHPQSAGLAAVTCGALVEGGADAAILGRPLLDRARRATRDAVRLVEASCLVAGAEQGEGLPIGDRWITQAWLREHINIDETAVQSFLALDAFYMSLVGTLSRDPALLRSPEVDELFDTMQTIGTMSEGASCLDRLLRVPMGETWLVLDLARDLGVELEVSGVADAFQVYTLLHRALHEAGKWKDAPPIEITRIADGSGPPSSAATYIPPFGLFRWAAIDENKSVPDNNTRIDDWYSNSAIPAELAPYEGRRIAIVGRCSLQMIFSAGRCFPSLPATVVPKRQLAASELDALWRALAFAARPGNPIPCVGWR